MSQLYRVLKGLHLNVFLYLATLSLVRSNFYRPDLRNLTEIRQCSSSQDCGGRLCFNKLCTGLAGTEDKNYFCLKGKKCIINSVSGYFYLSKQKTYEIGVVPYDSECSGRSLYVFDCNVTSENACKIYVPMDLLELGRYKLCGTAFPKEASSDSKRFGFKVPIGNLVIFGFKESQNTLGNVLKQKPPLKSHLFSQEITFKKENPKICTANVPCTISGIQGFGLSENSKVIEIYNSTSSTCGRDLDESEIVYPHKCTPYNDGTECYINSLSPKSQITTLCGCTITENINCNNSLDYNVYLGNVVYHRGIQNKDPDHETAKEITNSQSYTLNKEEGTETRKLQKVDPCASCVNGYGLCYGNPKTCYGGFGNNPYEPPLILCVDGYDCKVKGKILGEQITSRYKVAASPMMGCGVRILGREESMFNSQSQWNCEGGNPFDCEIHFGVGRRYNRSEISSNTMLLCGCPDFASVGMPCDDPAEYYFPVAQVRVVECTDNTHCMHNALASCNLETNQCQGVLPSVAQIGLGTMQCLSRQSCTIANIGQFIGGEMYRVIQTAPYVKCGANVALDPEYYQKVQTQMENTGPGGMGLPCIVQNDDSEEYRDPNSPKSNKCAINLGTNAILGVNRLCGCSGVDRDGNGIPCDSAEDFDTDLGLLDVGECNSDKDCKPGQVCTEHKCLNDQLLPYPTGFSPLNHSTLIPPVKQLVIRFNENIEYPKNWQPRRLVISSNVYYKTRPLEIPISPPQKESRSNNHHQQLTPMSSEEKTKNSDSSRWTWWNKAKNQGSNSNSASTPFTAPVLYSADVRDQKIVVSFDSRTPLPEDNYVVGLEAGAISDLHGNPNDGIPFWTFTISRNASCPYMYVTGFSTNNGNVNGLYMPWKAPKNGKAVWNGGERKQFYIYYSILDSDSKNGTWVIDRDLDSSDILSFAESVLPEPNNHIPPDGKSTNWKKWVSINPDEEPEWVDHSDISIICRSFPEKTPPSLIAIHPPLGSVDVSPNNTEIKLTFNRAMNYGHWAWFNITGRTTGHLIHIPTDFEAKNRGFSVISNQTSDVILRPYENLVEGEVYDITVELGALTDLTYQPWGNVGPNQLFFTTSGESCKELDLLSFYDHNDVSRYQLEYSHPPRNDRGTSDFIFFPPGTSARLKCNSGYSTKSIIKLENSKGQEKTQEDLEESESEIEQEGSFGCVRGKWQVVKKIHCYQKCKPYPISSSSSQNYIIQSNFSSEDSSSESEDHESEYLNGSKLLVKCVGTKGSEVITCKDGVWSALKLICGTSCPPYSLPNENYLFKYEKDRVKHTPESEITISCNKNSDKLIEYSEGKMAIDQESNEFKIICSQGRWESENQYKCFKKCISLSESAINSEKSVVIEYNEEINLGYLRHGSMARIKCSEEWSPVGQTGETIFGCYDGSWFVLDKDLSPTSILPSNSLPDELSCERKCKDMEIFSNKAYKIESLDLERGLPSSKIRISCERNFGSVQIGTRTSDIVECLNGVWGIPKTICMNHCESPEQVLGKAYSVNNELGSVKRKGLYVHGTRLLISCSDQGTLIQGGELHQTATCTNGEWIFDNVLICASKCSTLKLPAKYLIRSQNNSDFSADTGDTRIVTCTRPGNSEIEEVIVCKDGEWKPSVPSIDCFSNCNVEDLEPLREFFEILNIEEGRRSISHGEPVKIRCKKGYVRKTGPLRDTLKCYNGIFQVPSLICERPSCFDGIQNQGEFGVDCGGVCEKKCPETCFDGILNGDETSIDCGGSCGTENCPRCDDGIKNGDETGIDCGGSQCSTCEPCHGFPLSNLPEGTILSVDGGFSYIEDIQKESLLIDNMAIASGSELHIRCIPGWEQDESLKSKLQILACNDGKWSLPGPNEKMSLKCAAPSCEDGIQNGDEWGVDCGGSCENHCSSCNDGIKNGDETGIDCGGSSCRKCNSCDSEFIFRLESSGKYILSGNSLREEVPTHGSKLVVGCSSREASVTLTCNDGEWINRESVKSLPCGRNGLLKVSQATSMIEEDVLNIPLENFAYCNQNSGQCCKLIRRFSEVWSGECGTMYRQGRDTTIKTFCKGKCMNLLKESLKEYKKGNSDSVGREGNLGSEILSIECIAAKSISTIIESHLCQSSDIKGICSFSFHETLMIVNEPSLLLGQPKTLKQICEKDSCHRRNLKLIQALSHLSKVANQRVNENSGSKTETSFVRRQNSMYPTSQDDHLYGVSNINEDFWKQIILSQSEKSLNLLCLSIQNPSNPKEKYSCINSVSEMITSDRSSVSWLLSLIQEKDERENGDEREMKKKRNLVDMCIRNLPEDSCLFFATRVFGQLLLEVGTETKNQKMRQAGLLYRSFGRYFCQEAKNNRFCGQFLFGGVRNNPDWWDYFKSSIFGNISQKDICSPYHINFGCSPHCKKKLLDQLNNRKCCFAASLEIQRVILGIEKDTSKLNTERSVDYLEQRCGFSMDRVCSSGVKTDLIILEFIFKDLNFFEISNSIQEELLRNSIRETVSSFLSIPISDIPRIRAWPGSYIVEVLIDSGLSSRTVLMTLEEGIEQLGEELNKIDSIDREFGIKVSKSTISHSRSLSTSIAPPPPYVGTFDMDSLSNQLDFPNCPKPSLKTLGIEDQEDGYEINGDNSFKQGAFRNVACSYYFNPVPPSPASQSFICDNGRWRITQHEAKILCKKACKPFNLLSLSLPDLGENNVDDNNQKYIYNSNSSPKNLYTSIGYSGEMYSSSLSPYQSQMNSAPSKYIVSGVGNDHGSTRSISCSAGYVSDNPDMDSETFQCANGKWESHSEEKFNCVKGAEASLKYCRTSFLSNVLGTEKFMVEEQFDLSSKPDNWKVFKVSCSRGYEAKIEPILLACSNGNFYNIPGDTVTISKSNNSEFIYNLVVKTVFGGTNSENVGLSGSSRLIPKVPSISFSRGNSNFQEEIDSDSEKNIFSIIDCVPKEVMKLSESKGLSGPALYAILFAPLIFGMLILAILFWFRRYKWKKNFENNQNTEENKQTLAILDVKRKSNVCDIETASPVSELDRGSNQESSFLSKIQSPSEKRHIKSSTDVSHTLSGQTISEKGNLELSKIKEKKIYKEKGEKVVPEGKRGKQKGILL
ncbi:uncharacterized protein cubi_03127 [Cryptosporidium ubiquitum]|uniref:Sushi domain-containing protein n=1 Tax=Cryptosporidium ubiquitum TaxID=857276 RepID=A0A1J4ML97_9CRYT|nr:uncharacterized protein cubi_03127 [Cryptosporidium ubiquitum]OII75017.1 hypothetical protein cubi_03127 [Cryptosporidium ubiquitum]